MHPLSYIEYLEELTNECELTSRTREGCRRISQESLSTALTEYVINEVLPHSAVENRSFRKLIKGESTFRQAKTAVP